LTHLFGAADDSGPFIVLGTGSRAFTDKNVIWKAMADVVTPIPHWREIVLRSGHCPDGADAIMEDWARKYGMRVELHPAQNHPTQDFGPWPAAGPKRNNYMVSLGASVCLAFISPCTSPRCKRPDKHPSHGATGCANRAESVGIPVQRYFSE
jgi:hypothetical protein